MPIRPEHRPFYGADWRRFRAQLIDERGAFCFFCKRWYGPRRINAAHLDHNPPSRANVQLACPACHARHDAPHRLAVWRRNHATRTGQLWLSEEFERI